MTDAMDTGEEGGAEQTVAPRLKIVFSLTACVLLLAGSVLMLAVKPYRARLNVLRTQLEQADEETVFDVQDQWSDLSRAAFRFGNAAVGCAALGIIAWRIAAHRRESGLPAWLLPALLVIYLALHVWSMK